MFEMKYNTESFYSFLLSFSSTPGRLDLIKNCCLSGQLFRVNELPCLYLFGDHIGAEAAAPHCLIAIRPPLRLVVFPHTLPRAITRWVWWLYFKTATVWLFDWWEPWRVSWGGFWLSLLFSLFTYFESLAEIVLLLEPQLLNQ